MFPTLAQARRVMWDAIDPSTNIRMVDHIPEEQVIKKRENDMSIIIKALDNKGKLNAESFIQFLGADNFDANVGTPPFGIIFSEYSLTDPRAWALYAPILAENGGWAMFNFTPRGPNHAKELYDRNLHNPNWYISRLTVDDTEAVPLSEIANLRAEGMSEELIQQEFYCSFTAGMEGAYYARLLDEIREKKQIGKVKPDPNLQVYTAWDLGVRDQSAVWFFQLLPRAREIRIVHYYENSGVGMEHYINYARDWAAKNHVTLAMRHPAPPDIKVREFSTPGAL
jgi:hypothetical protein